MERLDNSDDSGSDEINMPEGKLDKMPKDIQREVRKRRQLVVRGLVDRVVIWADRIETEELLGERMVSMNGCYSQGVEC